MISLYIYIYIYIYIRYIYIHIYIYTYVIYAQARVRSHFFFRLKLYVGSHVQAQERAMFSKVPPCYTDQAHADEEPHRGTTAKGAPPALPSALSSTALEQPALPSALLPTALEQHGPDVLTKRPQSPVGEQAWRRRRKRKKVAGVYK